jgi:hypothetical protein
MFDFKAKYGFTGFILTMASFGITTTSLAAVAPSLGAANSFAIMAGTQINNAGATVISGDLGVSPGSVITGFPPGEVKDGAIHLADEKATQAQYDVTAAAISIGAQTADTKMNDPEMAGLTLAPGVYYFAASAVLNGALILDAKNDAEAVFIFQISGTFTAADGAAITVINGGKQSNVFFLVGNTATIGANAALIGNWIAFSKITLGNQSSITGKALSISGAVQLTANQITNEPVVAPSPTPTPTPSAEPTVYTVNCSFAAVAKEPALTCTGVGSFCIDGAKKCISQEKNIPNDLKITCSDGFTLEDLAATHSTAGTVLTVKAISATQAASIDFKEFSNKAATLSSTLHLTDPDATLRKVSGSCVIK